MNVEARWNQLCVEFLNIDLPLDVKKSMLREMKSLLPYLKE